MNAKLFQRSIAVHQAARVLTKRTARTMAVVDTIGLLWLAVMVAGVFPPTSLQAADTQQPPLIAHPVAATQPVTASLPASAKPVIKVDKVQHDFGTLWMAGVLKHAFVITNAGDADLQMTEVRPLCGCTLAGTYPNVIKPGQSGSFPFSVDASRYPGKQSKYINITCNDPQKRQLQLSLTFDNKQYVEVKPPSVYFARLTGDKPEEQVIHIKSNAQQPLKLTLVAPATQPGTMNFAKFELVEKTPDKEFELRVASVPPYKTGNLFSQVTLQTNIEAQKTIPIFVRGRVAERFEVVPNLLYLLEREPGKKNYWPVNVSFTNNSGAPVKLLETTVDDPALKAQVTESVAGERFFVGVNIPEGYELPAQGRTLTIKTSDTQRPVIQVPIRSRPMVARPTTRPAVPPHPTTRPAFLMIGKKAPSFSLATLSGKTISDAGLSGATAVLNFVAADCPVCKRQVPQFEQIRADYEKKGVRFINVGETRIKRFANEEAADVFKKAGSNTDFAPDPDNKVGPLFKVDGFPMMVVVDKTGTIRHVNVGLSGTSQLVGQLNMLLGIKPALLMMGKKVPSFSLATLSGKTVSDMNLKNSIAVLNFVAPNCGSCKRQVPQVEKVRVDYEKKGVRFVNVNQTLIQAFTNEQVADVFKKIGSNLDLAPDPENKVGKLFQVTSYPTMMVVDKTGTIKHVNIGWPEATGLPGQLDALLGGKPSAPPAPAAASSREPRKTG